jgi:hypothetical protein
MEEGKGGAMVSRLRVVLVKPSKYEPDGAVARFRRGVMPNSTLPHVRSLTPPSVRGLPVEVHAVDEYVHTDLEYLRLLEPEAGVRTLLALVGVQSHQFHRALDLGAYARARGALAVIGGPHPMTCDTSAAEGRGVSFAQAEAERVWPAVLEDAVSGELRPAYGREGRWAPALDAPVLEPPSPRELARYVVPMVGLYPARGCPFACTFCSVIKIAGRRVRSQPVAATMAGLRAARAAGVRMVMFTLDNFNKYPEAPELLEAMAAERLGLKFFVQCDVQVARQEGFVELLARAGCFQMLVGVESFRRGTLLAVRKAQNHPELYGRIVELCDRHGILSHFTNIVGFPEDTEESVAEHVRELDRLDPAVATFYILTPMPGTEQYEDFLSRGLITEPDLDRFDATGPVWRHPNLSAARLRELLFRCYREFYSPRRAAAAARRMRWGRGERGVYALALWGKWLHCRFAAWKGEHPYSGGVGRVRRDRAADYRDLRRRTFGFERAPLPRALALAPADEALNRSVNPRLEPVA